MYLLLAHVVGSAYIYDISLEVDPETKLLASDAATFSQFGWSVSVDGDTVVVGAHHENNEGFIL